MAVRMALSRIFIREMTDMQIIELSEVDGLGRTFPIVIGLPEAFAIERRLNGIEIPRPQTHDLLASVINQMGGTLTSIIIHDLDDGTYYANLIIDQDGVEHAIDSRPSDAIALGIASGVPIYVSEDVLESACADPMLDIDNLGDPTSEFDIGFDDEEEHEDDV